MYDADALRDFLKSLRSPDRIIAKSRLDLIDTTMRGLKTDHKAKVLMSAYRKRNRDKWPEFVGMYRDHTDVVKADEVDYWYALQSGQNLSTREYANALKTTFYSSEMVQALHRCLPEEVQPGTVSPTRLRPARINNSKKPAAKLSRCRNYHAHSILHNNVNNDNKDLFGLYSILKQKPIISTKVISLPSLFITFIPFSCFLSISSDYDYNLFFPLRYYTIIITRAPLLACYTITITCALISFPLAAPLPSPVWENT